MIHLDPWQPVIERWICGREYITVRQILEACIETDFSQSNRNRVARCLKALGWQRYQQRMDNRNREWRYRRSPVLLDGW